MSSSFDKALFDKAYREMKEKLNNYHKEDSFSIYKETVKKIYPEALLALSSLIISYYSIPKASSFIFKDIKQPLNMYTAIASSVFFTFMGTYLIIKNIIEKYNETMYSILRSKIKKFAGKTSDNSLITQILENGCSFLRKSNKLDRLFLFKYHHDDYRFFRFLGRYRLFYSLIDRIPNWCTLRRPKISLIISGGFDKIKIYYNTKK